MLGDWLLIGAAGALAAGSVTQRQRRLRRLRHVLQSFHFPSARPHVVILSASIGGGHNAAAAVLRHDLEALGCHVTVLDGFALATPLLSRYFAWAYPVQLRYAPWLYDWQFWSSHQPRWTRFWRTVYCGLAADTLDQLLGRLRPDIVVSTYPLVTQVLGQLRRERRLDVPAVAVITDYGVHRLWTAPGVDLHLVPSAVSAALVTEANGPVRVMRPLVRAAFREPVDRTWARRQYGWADHEFVALVAAGAWGIGQVEEIVRDVSACGVRTVVVCGKNGDLVTRLQNEHRGRPRVHVFGWRDDLPTLMAAADCLVQNAGGITCLEAIARGLPILLYRPIAGHGRLNAETMERAGVARWIRDRGELHQLLHAAVKGELRLTPPTTEPDAVPAAEAILACLTRPTGVDRFERIMLPGEWPRGLERSRGADR